MRFLAELATSVACLGGFMFGYDTGVISGVLVMKEFLVAFGLDKMSPAQVTLLKGNVVALLQAGCAVGAFLINFLADPLGRRWAIIISSAIFVVGGIMQFVAAPNLNVLIAGRFIAGLGIGGDSMLVPMYIAEIAPRRLRGRLGTLWQFLIVVGICVSYWIDYGTLRGFPTDNRQWQVALGLQIVPGVILCCGMLFLPESIRWLALHHKEEKALATLSRLRNLPVDSPEIQEEWQEITVAIELERESHAGSWSELLQPANLKRVILGMLLQTFQQWTGTNAINYYAPQIFQSIGLSSNETDILATGVYGAVKVAFVALSFFMIDTKLGRRRTLMIGSVFMCTAFYILGGMTKRIADLNNGKVGGSGSQVGAEGYVAIIMVYFFAVGYEFSWGPIVWIVCSEIFPNRIRAKALSCTTAINWAMNAVIAKVTPIMLANITWGTYFFFGSCAVIMGVFVFFFLPETRGRSLEEMEEIFSSGIIARERKYVHDAEKGDAE